MHVVAIGSLHAYLSEILSEENWLIIKVSENIDKRVSACFPILKLSATHV